MLATRPRTIGYQLTFEDTSVDRLLASLDDIKEEVKKHGVVCLKQVDLNEADLITLAKKFGDEVVVLPEELSFNNKDLRYPPIARIGNILLDGTLKDSAKEATVWH